MRSGTTFGTVSAECLLRPCLGVMMIDDTRSRRIRWRCRRGMLENDLILARFLDASGDTLTEADVANLDELLNMTDNALWDLLSGRAEAGDPTLAAFVTRLRAASTQPKDVR